MFEQEGGVWSKAQEQLGIHLKVLKCKTDKITVRLFQNTFETMQTSYKNT